MINNAMTQAMIRNPQQFARRALNTGRFNNNDFMRNTLEAVANNNVDEMKKILENSCMERNVSVEDTKKKWEEFYGVKLNF